MEKQKYEKLWNEFNENQKKWNITLLNLSNEIKLKETEKELLEEYFMKEIDRLELKVGSNATSIQCLPYDGTIPSFNESETKSSCSTESDKAQLIVNLNEKDK